VVVTVVAWASAFVVIRGTGASFSPGALALGRMLVGTLALSLLLIGVRWVRPSAREWVLLLVYGALWFGAYNITLNLAEQTLDAGTTAMVVGIGPVLIALGAALTLGEGMRRWLGIGLAVSFAGVLLIGVASGVQSAPLGLGVVAAVVSAVAYAGGVLLQKPTLRRLPAAQVTFLGAAAGTVVCLPFAGRLIDELGEATPLAISGFVYLGVIPTALAFSTWAYALKRMPAGQLGVTTYVEVPTVLAIVGGVLCLAGVGISRRHSRPAAK
jgi:drug/metabolite transporter (DMT)-like permease